jgi:hypothetical protein
MKLTVSGGSPAPVLVLGRKRKSMDHRRIAAACEM